MRSFEDEEHFSSLGDVGFSPDGKRLMVISGSDAMCLDFTTKRLAYIVKGVASFGFSPDSKLLVTVSFKTERVDAILRFKGSVILRDANDGTKVKDLIADVPADPVFGDEGAVKFSRNSKTLGVALMVNSHHIGSHARTDILVFRGFAQ